MARRHPAWTTTLQLLLAWSLLNVMLNLRAPLREPLIASLLPSLDTTILLACFAIAGWAARRWRWFTNLRLAGLVFLFLLALVVLVLRIFRLGDGIAQLFQSRPANLFVDAPMLPELARLLHSTMPSWQFALVVLGVGIAAPLLVWATFRCSLVCARTLTQPHPRIAFAGIALLLAALSAVLPAPEDPTRYTGAFSASVAPRLRADLNLFIQSRELSRQLVQRMSEARERFAQSTGDLAKLGDANVLIFVVESYGNTLLTTPIYAERVAALYEKYESTLKRHGFHYASRLIDSPTNGGYSWFAHSTLMTGVRIAHQQDYHAITAAEPKGLVHYLREAGYFTVSAEPGTTRLSKGPDLYKWDFVVSAQRFGYQGPKFSWAPMTDQFVIDVIHRRVIQDQPRPVFVKYSLVSSHGPWNIQPPLIEDWSTIGDGSLYHQLPPVEFPTSWTDLSAAHLPFMHSIEYTLGVILRYLEKVVKDGSLVVIVGDHQPTGMITKHTTDTTVPIHVISRRPSFIERFIRRGYTQTMRPKSDETPPGMETFAGDFLEDFSH